MEPSTAALISPADYARHRGVSRAAVRYAIRDERIPVVQIGARRLIDPAAADAAWAANTDLRKPRNSVSGDPAGNGHAAAPAPGTFRFHQSRLEEMKADLAALELAKKSGQLIPADEVERQAFDRARAAQKALLAIPARLPISEAERQLLRIEILRVCEQVAGEALPHPAPEIRQNEQPKAAPVTARR